MVGLFCIGIPRARPHINGFGLQSAGKRVCRLRTCEQADKGGKALAQPVPLSPEEIF